MKSFTNDNSKEKIMDKKTEEIYAKLTELEREIENLRQGYIIVNARYNKVLVSAGFER